MSRRFSCVSLVAMIVVSLGLGAQEDEPRYVEDPVLPKYQRLTVEQVEKALTVRSSRSYAGFGYNAPSVVVQLPTADNSVFARVTFDDPVLLDGDAAVEYEREDGNYDHDTHTVSVRMVDAVGEPVQYTLARGKARVRYPAVIRTHRVAVADADGMKKLGLRIDGREVAVKLSDAVPEAATFASISEIRVFDDSGRMIEDEGGWSGWGDDGGDYRQYAYRADIATIEVDRVEEWVGLAIEYELPASPLRAEELVGTVPDPDPLLANTPPGTMSIELVQLVPESVLGFAAGLSMDEILEVLESHGYNQIDDEAIIVAATSSNADAIRLLLAAGVSPNVRLGDSTPLLSAASFAESDVIELLVAAGADVNVGNEHNATPLIWLSNRCSMTDVEDSARLLIEAGADVNAKAKGGGTALMMADALQCEGLAKMLRDAGAAE